MSNSLRQQQFHTLHPSLPSITQVITPINQTEKLSSPNLLFFNGNASSQDVRETIAGSFLKENYQEKNDAH